MASQLWLEDLRRELRRRRLPRHYIERFVGELSDHFQDFTEEVSMSMDATACSRFGSPEHVADAAASEYRRRSVFNRRPLLAFSMFVLLPIPLFILCGAALLWGGITLGELAGLTPETEGVHPVMTWHIILGHAVVLAIILGPAAALATMYSWLARRTIRVARWTIASCLILAIGVAMVHYSLVFSPEPGKSQLMVGINVGNEFSMSTAQCVQFIVPLAIGVLFLVRQSRRERQMLAV
jgi:predicted anti-sigma-YlaC factor YlaD